MNGVPKIPEIIAKLELPEEIKNMLTQQAFSHGLDIQLVLDAFRSIYALGFYDGAFLGRAQGCLISLSGENYDRQL